MTKEERPAARQILCPIKTLKYPLTYSNNIGIDDLDRKIMLQGGAKPLNPHQHSFLRPFNKI